MKGLLVWVLKVVLGLPLDTDEPPVSDQALALLEDDLSRGVVQEKKLLEALLFLIRESRIPEALDLLDKAFACGAHTLPLLELAFDLDLELGRYSAAFVWAKRACYEHDRRGQALLRLANTALLNTRYSLAAAWLYEFLEDNPHDTRALSMLGECFLRRRGFQKALDCYTRPARALPEAQLFPTMHGYRQKSSRRARIFGSSSSDLPVDPDLLAWLRAMVEEGRRPLRQDWRGRRARPTIAVPSTSWLRAAFTAPLDKRIRDLVGLDQVLNSGVYVPNQSRFEQVEVWQAPAQFERERKGDCEDFALYAWVQLNRMGYRARFVLGAMCGFEQNHAWVQIYRRNLVQVLECTPRGQNDPLDANHACENCPMWSLDRDLHWYRHSV